MEFIINQNSASENASGYFSAGICILETTARLLWKYCYKLLKKAITDSHMSMGTTQCQHTIETQKLSNVVNQHTIFKKSVINPKCCKILSTFCQQFQPSLFFGPTTLTSTIIQDDD